MWKCLVRPSVRRSRVPVATVGSPAVEGDGEVAGGRGASGSVAFRFGGPGVAPRDSSVMGGTVVGVQEAADQGAVHVVQLRGFLLAPGHDLRATGGEPAALRGAG